MVTRLVFYTLLLLASENCSNAKDSNNPQSGSADISLKVRPSRRNCIETGWYPRVLVSGPTKDAIKSIPIEFRPNRPLHFYGNTVRRKYYRGNPFPQPRDIFRTGCALIRR